MENRGPWLEGSQAWSRLEAWYRDVWLARAWDAGDGGDRALTVLEDSGMVRRLLDQVEFEAVRTARKNGRSWAEIAVKLGVTRQSAWERWRDVDEPVSTQADGPAGAQSSGSADVQPGGSASIQSGDFMPEAEQLIERSAREWRRRSSVIVSNVIGMSYDVARKILHDKRLVPEGADPDGPPLGVLGWPDGVVTDQSPESGAKVPPGSVVRLWVERGGGSGVREPRRPLPDPMSGRQMRDESADEAVS